MYALGSYDRMVDEIKRRENRELPVTFGILIADYRQRDNKEYILNYIDVFDYKSNKYINFYLPGYLEENFDNRNEKINIRGREYYFNDEIYKEFLRKLDDDFNIDYPYTPVLLLIEYINGHFNMSKKIRIELDDSSTNIRKTGILFEKIFSIAQKNVSLHEIEKNLIIKDITSGMLDSFVDAVDIKLISLGYDSFKKITKYKIG